MLTVKEAYELGLPGTYMGDDGAGGPSDYFPAAFCMRCIGDPSQMGEHDGCVWKYWGTTSWMPSPEEIANFQENFKDILSDQDDLSWVPE